ncbi:MAG: sulfatase-like hydrolase/transferase [Lentisphaeraceae bacterium]|nr:sulfatase-like hydrolase/transferase [Lentisphaeraceae bacterium]
MNKVFFYTLLFLTVCLTGNSQDKPNVILIMADDLGWGDTGYNGNKIIKTPHLDQMAKDGLQMNRFYSASSVCSPTRASCLTGRNPYRTGIFTANKGILRPEEVTLPEILKSQGYATGHFGKWHLGTLTTTEKDANRGKKGNTKEFNPPKLHGYDAAFVTESKVPTYDPMWKPKKFEKGESLKMGWSYIKEDEEKVPYGTSYWDIAGNKVTDNLDGDDSKIIMDRAIPFIEKAVSEKKPFLSVIWFHTPHLPCVAGPKHQEMYKDFPLERRNYAGCVTALDEQIGRLRAHLKKIGADQNTMIWFCSDNGPESKANANNGTAADFRGRKRDLYEGGVRVPGLLVWPAKITEARQTDVPCITSDYVPTVLDALQLKHPQPSYILDGVSLLPLIEGKVNKRSEPLGIMFTNRLNFSNNKYKLISYDGGKSYKLYDMINDKSETKDISQSHPEIVSEMKKQAMLWYNSTKQSFLGEEYGKESFDKLGQTWQGPLDLKMKKKKSKK